MRGLLTVLLMALSAKEAFGAKILALMVVPSPSHHHWNTKYLEALVERGHHVTYFSVDEYKNRPKNLTHIWVKGAYDQFGELDFVSMHDTGVYENILLMRNFENLESQFLWKTDGIKQLVQLCKKEKFDLVVNDIAVVPFLLGAVDVAGRPPVVGITAFSVPTSVLDILGNPISSATKPFFYGTYSDTMTLLQRANNFFVHLFSSTIRWFEMREQNEYSKKCFGSDVRSLEEIMQDMNIIMVNMNRGVDFPFPMVPGLIPVGGLHIRPPKPLPQALQTFLDGSKDGVVYFSLGTNIQSFMIKEKIEILLKAFEQLAPVRVLWKLDPNFLPREVKNVKVEKWLPQNDILAHPNVRLFFTHSGLLSTQEAMYHGKPIVGMPFLVDQFTNLQRCLEKGLGEKLSYQDLEVGKIVSTIRKVLENPRYSENARKVSALFRDEMDDPLDRAVFWTEYAIRHGGAPHLRHSARNLAWYQNSMLDVFVLIVCSILIISFSLYKITTTIFSAIFGGGVSKQKTN